MTWNLRLVKHTECKPRGVWYGVHEVFYNDAGRPWTMTEDPEPIVGESREEVLRYLEMIRRDLARLPVLDAQKTRWAKPPRGIRGGRTRASNMKGVTAAEFDRLFERGEAFETLDLKSATTRSHLQKLQQSKQLTARS